MAAEGMPFPWRPNRSKISANLELIWEMSVIPDNIAEFLGPMMGVGVAEITVIVVATGGWVATTTAGNTAAIDSPQPCPRTGRRRAGRRRGRRNRYAVLLFYGLLNSLFGPR